LRLRRYGNGLGRMILIRSNGTYGYSTPAMECSFSSGKHGKYTVIWMCTLVIKIAVVVGMLDK
jgi:hypothetical protein